MYITRYSCPILIKLELFRQFFFQKYSKIKFHENASSGTRVVPYGRKDTQTDITKLIVAFRNFANMPKNLNSVAFFGSYLAIFRPQKKVQRENVIIIIVIIIIAKILTKIVHTYNTHTHIYVYTYIRTYIHTYIRTYIRT
jgi:hypothetical protein